MYYFTLSMVIINHNNITNVKKKDAVKHFYIF